MPEYVKVLLLNLLSGKLLGTGPGQLNWRDLLSVVTNGLIVLAAEVVVRMYEALQANPEPTPDHVLKLLIVGGVLKLIQRLATPQRPIPPANP